MFARPISDMTIVVAAGVGILLLGILAAVVAPPADAVDGGTSTYSAGPRGMKGAYLTLRELGYRAERSVEPATAVRADPASTTMILSGAEAPSEQDRRAIQAFIQQGGIVVAIGSNGAFALGLTTVAGHVPSFDERVERFSRIIPSALSAGAAEISMHVDGVQPSLPDAYVPLYGATADEPVVATASIGRGRAVWLADSTPLSNKYLGQAGNLRLLLNVAGPQAGRRVLFDEHYQGYKRSLWSYVSATPLPWIGLQGGLVLAAVLLTHSRRRGPVRAAHVDARTSPMEFVEMLGTLYGRARARQAAVHAARTRLRRAIATTCGIPLASDDDTLARAAEARMGGDEALTAQLLADAARAAGDPDLGQEQALALTRRLQELSARLHNVRTTAPAFAQVLRPNNVRS